MSFPAEMPEAELERARQAVAALNDGASTLGLYTKQAQIGLDADGRTTIVMDFRVGNLAFTDRVQDPDADAERDALRALETDVVRAAGTDAFLESLRKLRGDEDDA